MRKKKKKEMIFSLLIKFGKKNNRTLQKSCLFHLSQNNIHTLISIPDAIKTNKEKKDKKKRKEERKDRKT